MSRQWFVRRGNREVGPMSAARLRELAAAGKIGPDDEVRRDDREQFVPASRIPGLFPDDEDLPDADVDEYAAPLPTAPRPATRGKKRPAKKSSNTAIWLIVGGVASVCLLGCCVLGVALFLPAVQLARNAARTVQSKNNLKQVGLAMHNYHDVYSTLPGGIVDDNGTALHSWQTQLLPYLSQKPLYDRVDLTQAWSEPAQRPVFSSSLPMFLNPKNPQTTNAEGYALSHYAANSQVLRPGGNTRLRDIVSGTSNTVAAGEVGSDLRPWGDPGNARDFANGLTGTPQGFGRAGESSCAILMMDGSVRIISAKAPPEVIRGLASPKEMPPNGDHFVN